MKKEQKRREQRYVSQGQGLYTFLINNKQSATFYGSSFKDAERIARVFANARSETGVDICVIGYQQV